MYLALPLLVCLLGLIVYTLPTQAKVGELARISFAMGLLVVLLTAERIGKLF